MDAQLALRLVKTTGRDQAAGRVATDRLEIHVDGEVAGGIRFRAETWITCNPDNLASRRTCERLGAIFVDTLGSKCRYRLDLNPSDPPARLPVAPSTPNE